MRNSLRIPSLALALVQLTFSSIVMGFGGKAPVNDDQPRDCNFACKEVPPFSQVMKQYGNYSRNVLLEGERFKFGVTVWNIHKQKDQGIFPDLTQFASQSKILVLQETEINSSFETPTGWGLDLATAFITSRNAPTGVANLSAAKPIRSWAFRTTDLEPFVKSPKMQILSTYKLAANSEKELLVVNIHGINFKNTAGLERQLKQIVPDISAHVGPVIYGGDFNSKNKERLALVRKYANDLGLTEITFSGDNRKDGDKLDLVFVKDLEVSGAYMRTDLSSSDHPVFFFEATLMD